MDRALMQMAVEDVRAKAEARFELMRFLDQQAMQLLGYYAALATAAGGAALSWFGSNPVVPGIASIGLGITAVMFTVGSWRCLKVMKSATINLPGEDTGFWRWMIDNAEIGDADALRRYLDRVDMRTDVGAKLNSEAARNLALARSIGVWAPASGLLAGVLLALAPILT